MPHRGLHVKLWGPKVAGVLGVGILGLPLGSLETKCHLDVAPVERHREYCKGECGGFPQVRTMVSLVNPSCLWFVLAPKVLQPCTNHLVLVLCRSMWAIEACQFSLVPFQSSSTLLYPSKVLWARERAPTSYSFVVFYLRPTFESLKSWERVKWAPTLRVRVPMDSRIFKERLHGSQLIVLNSFLYHWKSSWSVNV